MCHGLYCHEDNHGEVFVVHHLRDAALRKRFTTNCGHTWALRQPALPGRGRCQINVRGLPGTTLKQPARSGNRHDLKQPANRFFQLLERVPLGLSSDEQRVCCR